MNEPNIPSDPRAVLMRMLGGQILSRSIGLAADLGVADRLADGPLSVDSLASAIDAEPEPLYRVLRMLAGFGIFEELADRNFQNNDLSEPLREDVEGSVRHIARWMVDPLRWGALGDLDYSVRSGRSALQKDQEERGVFDVFGEHPESVATFNQAMTSVSQGEGHEVVELYDFTPYGHIVDVGGGHGLLAVLIARSAPQARVTIFDLPRTSAGARATIEASGLGGRVDAKPGNYLDSVPGPADLVVMKNIVHGEDDEGAVRLLANCRAALTEGGKVLVIESVVRDGPAGNGARMMDVEMLFGSGGRQRTEEEHRSILASAGLHLDGIAHTPGGTSLVEASVAP